MTKRILFVDDERQILRALKRLFIDSDYETVFMDNGEDALAYLEDHPVELIISDIRMPSMNGFDLLKKVKEMHPLTLRVALSGYTDSKKIYKALEENIAKMYMFKPWDNKELLNIIDQMLELEDLLKNRELLDLINNINDLPTVPQLYLDIKRLIQEEADVDAIAKKIEEDPPITSRILRVANSAFYGAKTGSISQSIMYIGLINVKNIVLSNGVFDAAKSHSSSVKILWEHATITNKITNLIYQEFMKKKIPNIFASAGLLHDIGKVIMFTHFGDTYDAVLKEALDTNRPIVELEREHYNVTHQELGGYLLNWWEIPLPIVETALYHHKPLDAKVINKELVAIVHLANYYSWLWLDRKEFLNHLDEEVFAFLQIDQERLEAEIQMSMKDINWKRQS